MASYTLLDLPRYCSRNPSSFPSLTFCPEREIFRSFIEYCAREKRKKRKRFHSFFENEIYRGAYSVLFPIDRHLSLSFSFIL